MNADELKPGQRVRILQTIRRREGDLRTDVVGTVVSSTSQKTGSWYAHSKDAFLWLRRVCVQKDDGELTTVVVDPRTEIEALGGDVPTNR